MLRDAPLSDRENHPRTPPSPDSPGMLDRQQTVDEMLTVPFESTHHDVRGGVAIDYLTGEQVISRLLNVLGASGWSFSVLQHDIHPEADEVWVLGELKLLLTPGDPVVRQQFGSSKIKRARSTGVPLDIGFDLKSAATDCLKKCATLVGVGLYLTHKDEQRPGTATTQTHSSGAQPRGGTRSRDRRQAPTSAPSEPAQQGPSDPAMVLICEHCGEPLKATPTKDGGELTPIQLAEYSRRQHKLTLCASCVRNARDTPTPAGPNPAS
jgi:hypothetical protein